MPSWKSIDIEELISEIEARPTIWNVSSAEYKVRIKKNSQLFAAFFQPVRSEVSLAVFESNCHLLRLSEEKFPGRERGGNGKKTKK